MFARRSLLRYLYFHTDAARMAVLEGMAPVEHSLLDSKRIQFLLYSTVQILYTKCTYISCTVKIIWLGPLS